jgi:hypothetical protein
VSVHESNRRLRGLLARRGSYPAIAAAVTSGALPRFPVRLFAHVGWKMASDDDLGGWVETSRPYLALILLFELAHECRPTPAMERAAEVGGLRGALACWAARLGAARAASAS